MAELPDMSAPRTLAEAAAAAAALTEAVFLAAGQALETPIGALARMAVTSEHVIDDLAGGSLTEALAALSRAAGLIGRMGHATPDETAEFGRLDALATELAARIGKMIRSLGGVDPLAINARVVAAGIRSSSVDFSTFADDIARTLGRTRSSLHAFQTELRTVAGRIAAARSLQTAFQERRAMAASSLPARLRQTVDALASQHQRAAAASSGVRRSIDGIQARVGEAVIALQIGDITRQRLEHVQRGLILLSGTLDGPDAPEAPADAAALTATMCHLLCAQVADAAADFDRDVARVVASVDGLRSEAEALRDLAIATSGATAQGGGVADLEAPTGEALALFQTFGAARTEAIGIVATVGDAAEGLCGHLRDVQSLEADIRIMGLNTTFRCARIGAEGRPLSLIAQQLRTYADGFAKEAGALIREVDLMTRMTRGLIESGEADAAASGADVVEAMTSAMATLRRVGRNVGAALADLDGESAQVLAAIGDTVQRLAEHAAVAEAMRRMHEALAGLAQAPDAAALTPRAAGLLDRMAAGYTMDGERLVHERALGRAAGAAPAQSAVTQGGPPHATGAAGEIDDMLF